MRDLRIIQEKPNMLVMSYPHLVHSQMALDLSTMVKESGAQKGYVILIMNQTSNPDKRDRKTDTIITLS